MAPMACHTGGLNYGTPLAAVRTFNITGKGTGLKLGVSVGAGASAITAATISIAGNGYKVGDMVGIVTADMSGSGTGVSDVAGYYIKPLLKTKGHTPYKRLRAPFLTI